MNSSLSSSSPEALESNRGHILRNEQEPIPYGAYAEALDIHVEKPETQEVLRPDQITRLLELKQFFIDGAERGYVQEATGAGKSVLMVHVVKAFQNLEQIVGRKPNIAIATSRRNLVDQIIGKNNDPNEEKGFTRFAPELSVGSYFSNSKAGEKDNTLSYDAVVTTYNSLKIMAATELTRNLTNQEEAELLQKTIDFYVKEYGPNNNKDIFGQLNAIKSKFGAPNRVSLGRSVISQFDLFMFDEGHHLMGEGTEEILANDIPEGLPKIAWTATPDANEAKRLQNTFPYVISKRNTRQAIEAGILAPVVVIGLKSDAKIKGADLYDSSGEYRDERLSFLARDNRRNLVAIKAARVLIDHGIGVIMPCLPGGEALHARVMADQMFGFDIEARAVYSNSPNQKQVLAAYEAGEIDALTYTRLLGEGYDSDRTKGLINLSPTRSNIIGPQRLGRILRRNGDVAFAIDIIDEYDELNPPIHVSDVLGGQHMETGDVVGELTDEQREFTEKVIEALRKVVPLADEVRADYTAGLGTFKNYPPIMGSGLSARREREEATALHYASAQNVSRGYVGVSEEILNKLWTMRGKEPDVIYGHDSYTIRPTYNAQVGEKYLDAMPRGNPERALKDPATGDVWWSAKGYATYLGTKYPEATPKVIENLLSEFENLIEWQPACFVDPQMRGGANRYVYKIYKTTPESTEWLVRSVETYIDMLRAAERSVMGRKRKNGK